MGPLSQAAPKPTDLQPVKMTPGKIDPMQINATLKKVADTLAEPGFIDQAMQTVEQAKSPAHGVGEVTFQILKSLFKIAGGKLKATMLPAVLTKSVTLVAHGLRSAGAELPEGVEAEAKQVVLLQVMRSAGLPTKNTEAAMAKMRDQNAQAPV